MPKVAKELDALAVRRLGPGVHQVGGVAGLLAQVTATGARTWLLRFRHDGRRHEMGLGPYPEISLADARTKAGELREQLREGVNPLAQRQTQRQQRKAEQARRLTFATCAEQYIDLQRPSWKSDKHAQQWTASLGTYVYPVIGDMAAADISEADVLRLLTPIWLAKPETASRVRQRIEVVLDYAAVCGARPKGVNPAAWKGNLSHALPARSKLSRGKFPALPYTLAGEFFARLQGLPGVAAACVRFLMLTAARSGEARGANWSEIDMDAGTWTVPAVRMKAGREHVVALSPAALAELRTLPHREGLLYPGPSSSDGMRNEFSDMALTAVIRRLDSVEPGRWHDPKMQRLATVHGLRSTFRTWVAESTSHAPALAEAALAHVSGDAVEQAYQRGDMLERRRALMADWAGFVLGTPKLALVKAGGKKVTA